MQTLNAQLGKTALMTRAQLALRSLDDRYWNPRAKCPFVPQREMIKKLWGRHEDPFAYKTEWGKRLAKVSRHHFIKA